MDMSTIIQSLRDRGRKMASLDTPKDADLGDTALDIGAGFLPGVGTALSARDFERARREGDYLGMGFGAAGMIPVVGGAAGAVNKARRMSKAEAEAAGYWHPIGLGKKLEKPYQDISFKTEQIADLPARKQITLEDLRGQYVVPAVGDRTAANRLLTEIEGAKLKRPVHLEGGPDFMLTHGSVPGKDSTMWASGQAITTGLRNRALQAEELGGAANLMYVPMSYDSLNFSRMALDAALEALRGGKVSGASKKQFDESVRELRPEFAGINSPKALEQLEKNGALRLAFLDRMQLDKFRREGFPDLAAVRKAIMEPALENVAPYHSGYTVGRFDTSKPNTKTPAIPHKTYNTQIPGHVVGGLDTPVPHSLIWRDFFNERRARGMPESGDRMAFERSKPLQLVDQQLLDTVMPYVEALRRSGRP